MTTETTTHPLVDPNSPHYRMADDVEAIQRLEQMYTIPELMAWANISAMAYRLRIGHKDDPKRETEKILKFEAYLKYLNELNDKIQAQAQAEADNVVLTQEQIEAMRGMQDAEATQ